MQGSDKDASRFMSVSCITEIQTEASPCVESAECDDDDDEGEVSLYFHTLMCSSR